MALIKNKLRSTLTYRRLSASENDVLNTVLFTDTVDKFATKKTVLGLTEVAYVCMCVLNEQSSTFH